MRYVSRAMLIAVLTAVGISGPSGCSKDESKPNPELKVPDVPPSGSGQKKMPGKK